MNVRELIEQLSQCDPADEVFLKGEETRPRRIDEVFETGHGVDIYWVEE